MIQILEENEFFIVLLKPPGFSVHNQSPSVAEYLLQSKKPLHFVNRLDQETSGLMIVAKKPSLHEALVNSLDTGKKFYRALLRGNYASEKTEWDWSITDTSEGRENPRGKSAERVEALTRISVLRQNKYFTEIMAELLTGRQHQIRKHAAIAKHPIVGDKRYNEKKYNAMIAERYGVERMHLYAEKLEFSFQGKNYFYEVKTVLDRFFEI